MKNIKSVSTDLLNAITGIQEYIDAINTVFTLGVSWPKDDIDFILKALDGKNFFFENKPRDLMDGIDLQQQCSNFYF